MRQIDKGEVVCLVCLSDNPDHQEVIYSLYRQMKDDGFNVHTIGIENPKTPHACFDEDNHYVKCPCRPGLSAAAFDIAGLRRIIGEAEAVSPDFLYFESVHIWNIPIALALRRQANILEVIHDVDPHDGSRAVRVANWCCAKSAHYTVIRNGKDRDLCALKYGLSRSRVLTLDSWRVFPPFDPPTKSGEVLFFGRLRKYKGLSALLSIAQKAPEVKFNVMGQSDQESLETIQMLRELPNVRVTEGFIESRQMDEAFHNADCIVIPYESASQSGIIMDAYRYSRPVVAYNVGAISEQVENGKTGFLVAPGDEDGFVDSVQDIVHSGSDSLTAWSYCAYEFGLKKYSAQGAVSRFVAMLSRLD